MQSSGLGIRKMEMNESKENKRMKKKMERRKKRKEGKGGKKRRKRIPKTLLVITTELTPFSPLIGKSQKKK